LRRKKWFVRVILSLSSQVIKQGNKGKKGLLLFVFWSVEEMYSCSNEPVAERLRGGNGTRLSMDLNRPFLEKNMLQNKEIQEFSLNRCCKVSEQRK